MPFIQKILTITYNKFGFLMVFTVYRDKLLFKNKLFFVLKQSLTVRF